jgi:glycosyltransferase involved in cell wall biosynthesis
MNVLAFSTLYPNTIRPSHGIFVETRTAQLAASGQARLQVVAPVPYAANTRLIAEQYRQLGRVPYREERRGITVSHPRYIAIPKIGMLPAPLLLYLGARRTVAALRAGGFEFDLIDAHYFYPDGVAAALLAREFRVPLVITARGSDIHLIPQFRLPRAMIRWAASRAQGVVTVCSALKDALVALDVAPDKIRVLRNGVDLARFSPLDKSAARAELGFDGPTLLCVGNLVELKGHGLVIRAMTMLPEMRLVVVGDGPLGGELRRLAGALGVSGRVQFVGTVAQVGLSKFYSAADVMVLASSREGWPNVLLEAMACGTPVVASNVWGIPEVVAAPEAGSLLEERTPDAIARTVRALFARMPSRAAVRAYAERFSWDDTTRGQFDLFDEILRRAHAAAP